MRPYATAGKTNLLGKYHLTGGFSLSPHCNAFQPIDDITLVSAVDVPPAKRCRRRGCKGWWPRYSGNDATE